MGKSIITLAAAILFTCSITTVNAQSFEQGNFIFSGGYGFGNLTKAVFGNYESGEGYNVTSMGPLFLKGEYALTNRIGFGVNVAYLGMNATAPDGVSADLSSGDAIDLKSYSVLGRMNFHFVRSDVIDFYGGAGFGYRGGRWKYTEGQADGSYQVDKNGVFPLGFETTLGVRVYPVPNFGFYTEVGAAKALAQFGVVARF